jgi:hypothetical protein
MISICFEAQLAVPHVELVQQRVGEGHELAKHLPGWALASARRCPVQALLVLPGAAPGARPNRKK